MLHLENLRGCWTLKGARKPGDNEAVGMEGRFQITAVCEMNCERVTTQTATILVFHKISARFTLLGLFFTAWCHSFLPVFTVYVHKFFSIDEDSDLHRKHVKYSISIISADQRQSGMKWPFSNYYVRSIIIISNNIIKRINILWTWITWMRWGS